ncbi:MAG: HU family DNA-binding protein [Bacteroidales bacterium]|nr:HU family DNA-binding protein [Bacteroidales bacterium]
MDNKELVERLSEKLGRSKADINKLIGALAEVVKTKASELDSIAVPGFGTFEAKKKNERVVTNPSSGKRMLVPPKITLGFKVSNVLKSKLKN